MFNHANCEEIMIWEKPIFTDLRFGFEVTMYIYNR
jgi:coenzyme PQQ precursor peptide PqqA